MTFSIEDLVLVALAEVASEYPTIPNEVEVLTETLLEFSYKMLRYCGMPPEQLPVDGMREMIGAKVKRTCAIWEVANRVNGSVAAN